MHSLKNMEWLERYRDMIPDFEGFREVQSQALPSTCRINTLKIDKLSLLDRFCESGIDYQSFAWYPLGLKLNLEGPGKLVENLLGYIHIQEELSMLPPLLLDPQPGELILDLCASPGSKTCQISQMMKNQGRVIANEPSLGRVAPLRSNCDRLGVMNVAITRYDGRRFPSRPVQFDRVLVDAPCSSEGRERRGPGVLCKSSSKRSMDLHRLQVDLLRSAIRLVKPGGIVVYSTCTYAPEENELVVEKVLDLARLEEISIPGLAACPGITGWSGKDLNRELCKTARYYPHLNDTGGFFVARLVKKQEHL
ncbi:MAG: RsmB/NOP family class I SAM-dependent RNA methyltransferase [Methanothrix sp.]|uniref:NOL1/NOP2/sun family putative RNA methylase n=1 Tax=Methanothrix sp. TaxID=90426 RepID=UPI003BB1A834